MIPKEVLLWCAIVSQTETSSVNVLHQKSQGELQYVTGPETSHHQLTTMIDGLEQAVLSQLRHALIEEGASFNAVQQREASLFEIKTLFSTARAQLLDREVPHHTPAEAQALDSVNSTALLQELAEAKQKLEPAQAAAEVASRARCEFLAYMSHEIRTPMTAILGFSEILQQADISSKHKQKAVQTIQRNGLYLLDVINEILDLAKVESGMLEIETLQVNPIQLAREVIEQLTSQAQAQGNSLHLELQNPVPETIWTDPTLLKQALLKLVSNSIKLTRQGSIQFTLEYDPPQNLLCFRIIDTGMGIPTERRKRVFQPFHQSKSSAPQKQVDIGMGFTITGRLAEILGGDLSLNHGQNLGSEFIFRIACGSFQETRLLSSLEEPPSAHRSAQSFSVNSELNGRILLVEDNPDNQRLIRFILNKAGAAVTIVPHGRAGLEAALATETPFDLILMDLQMPVMDGYQATQALRAAGYTGQIVALTAHALTGEHEKCLASGFDDCLTKPIERHVLIPRVAARLAWNTVAESPETKAASL